MSNFFINPGFLIAGILAISAPIIIHLLNRRRFKKIDWAAMDFLLEAQRLNRRRVRLEEIILLFLRCLAMILIGLFISRPSLNINMVGAFNTGQTERIIILDDSLSMGSGLKGEKPIEKLSLSLIKGFESLANNNDQDLITVVKTTEPARFSPNAQDLNEDSVSELLSSFKEIKASDKQGDLVSALNQVNRSFESKESNFEKVVYLLSDLRKTDWQDSGTANSNESVTDLINDPEVIDPLMAVRHPYSIENARAWISKHSQTYADSGGLNFAIEERKSGQLAGFVGMGGSDTEAGMGYW